MNLLCRLGLHRQRFVDAAFFSTAKRCGICLEWCNPADGAEVEAERKWWAENEARSIGGPSNAERMDS